MHFQTWQGDNYQASEVPNSRLVGKMDVEACMDKFRNKGDGYHYKQVSPDQFDALVQQIIAEKPELAVELEEDCENIHLKI